MRRLSRSSGRSLVLVGFSFYCRRADHDRPGDRAVRAAARRSRSSTADPHGRIEDQRDVRRVRVDVGWIPADHQHRPVRQPGACGVPALPVNWRTRRRLHNRHVHHQRPRIGYRGIRIEDHRVVVRRTGTAAAPDQNDTPVRQLCVSGAVKPYQQSTEVLRRIDDCEFPGVGRVRVDCWGCP